MLRQAWEWFWCLTFYFWADNQLRFDRFLFHCKISGYFLAAPLRIFRNDLQCLRQFPRISPLCNLVSAWKNDWVKFENNVAINLVAGAEHKTRSILLDTIIWKYDLSFDIINIWRILAVWNYAQVGTKSIRFKFQTLLIGTWVTFWTAGM